MKNIYKKNKMQGIFYLFYIVFQIQKVIAAETTTAIIAAMMSWCGVVACRVNRPAARNAQPPTPMQTKKIT
jgi:hypothetical protein